MNDIPTSILFSILGMLIVMSAFFSSSETGMMTLNRYRLRHLVKKNSAAPFWWSNCCHVPTG